MNTVVMIIFTIKVGLFGIPSTDRKQVFFQDMTSCKEQLEEQYQSRGNLKAERNSNSIRIVDEYNHTIRISVCKDL